MSEDNKMQWKTSNTTTYPIEPKQNKCEEWRGELERLQQSNWDVQASLDSGDLSTLSLSIHNIVQKTFSWELSFFFQFKSSISHVGCLKSHERIYKAIQISVWDACSKCRSTKLDTWVLVPLFQGGVLEQNQSIKQRFYDKNHL